MRGDWRNKKEGGGFKGNFVEPKDNKIMIY
jgi:hypothetical protein